MVVFERTTFLVIAKAAGTSAAALSSSFQSSSIAPRSSTSSRFVYDEDDEGMEGFRDTAGRLASTPLGSGFITSTDTNHLSHPNSTANATSTLDPERFEKVSELIKNFKLACAKLPAKSAQSEFHAVELKAPNFSAYIDSLTSNTYIMILVTDPTIQMASVKLNVQLARDHFEKLQAINLRS